MNLYISDGSRKETMQVTDGQTLLSSIYLMLVKCEPRNECSSTCAHLGL